MTGKDLIIYILENNLENEEFFTNEALPSSLFMTEMEAASEFDVGIETVRAWHKLGWVKGIDTKDELFILRKTKDPRKE